MSDARTTDAGTTCLLEDGQRLGWAEYGDRSGVPCLFLHGSPGGRLTGALQHERLSRIGVRALYPERPGYGASDPRPGRTVRDVADDLLRLLDALGLERVFVVGGSGGGPHALALAAAAPSRVRGVGVQCGAAPLLPEEVASQAEANQQAFARVHDEPALRAWAAQVREVMLGAGRGDLMKDAPASDRAMWERQAELMNRMLASALEPGVDGLVDDYQALWARPWGFEPEDVTAPVVWAHGDADVNVPVSAARRLAQRIPDCRFVLWEGVGHAAPPEATAELLAALLGRTLA